MPPSDSEPRFECVECPAAFHDYDEAVEHVKAHFNPSELILDRHNAAPEGPA